MGKNLEEQINQKKQNDLAALFICYARVDTVVRSINNLASQNIKSFYVSIDGPKGSEIKARQDSLIEILDFEAKRLRIELFVRRSEINHGLSKSVQSAVDWIFEKNERAIIFEDDLLVSSDTVSYTHLTLPTIYSV